MNQKKSMIKIAMLAMLLTITSLSYSQDWGIGVKLGDPNGLSIKKYNKKTAFELIVGTSNYWGNNRYYNNYYKHDNRFKDNGWEYVSYDQRSTPIAIQFRYLIHNNISGLDGLQWYYGIGGQFRHQRFRYKYKDQFGDTYYDQATDFGIGPDGILGLEYTFKEVPISVGADVNLYMEIIDQPFLFLFQGGLAIRYRF